MKSVPSSALQKLARLLRGFLSDRAGNIMIVVGVSLPVFITVLGMGFEVTLWYLAERSLQNAADSAAVAASMNKDGNYAAEARAVAAQYGFVDGSDNVSVTVTPGVTCPSGSGTCFQVTISKPTPLYLIRMAGYNGNITVNGERMVALTSSATAEQTMEKREYCILALAGLPGQSNNEGIRCNGCPKADLTGCNVMSNNTASCVGHTTLADIGDAYSTNNGCGVRQNSNQSHVYDPYDGLADNIPADPCGGVYPQIPSKKSDPALPAGNQWSGPKTIDGNVAVCGDLQLAGDVDVTNSAGDGGVLTIWNGRLDTNGHTLRTAAGYLTIVFAGGNGAYTHAPTGTGKLDFAAPTEGDWKGMAIYQAPTLTSGVDVAEAGNLPTWNITGMVYMPHADVTLSGAINKSATNGEACFGMVVDNIRVNGTGLSLDACGGVGLDLPYRNVPGRGKLVK
jgi:hypothetical protein